MKCEVPRILFMIQILLLHELFLVLSSSSIHSLFKKIGIENETKELFNFSKLDYIHLEDNLENSKLLLSVIKYPNALKRLIGKNKRNYFERENETKRDAFQGFIAKRRLLSFPDNQNLSLVGYSTINEGNGTKHLASSQDFKKQTSPEIARNKSNTDIPIPLHKTNHQFFIGISNFKSSENNTETANPSIYYDSQLNVAGILIPLNDEPSSNIYMYLNSLMNNDSFKSMFDNNDSGSTTSPLKINRTTNDIFDMLIENFDCVINEVPDLNISCIDVDFYSIGEYLPNDTILLDLSYGNEVKLIKPLFSHLKNLKSLVLTNNHHRYITRAFMGLEKLERLDLSNNDIIVLLNAFSYVPRLRTLNLSRNQIRRIRGISNALRFLRNLENLILNHNVYISHIEKEDLYYLANCNISLFSLFNTTLQNVEKGSFSFIPNLKILEISVNYLDEQALANVTCGISENVEILYFGQMLRIKEFPSDALKCLTNAKVKKLYLWYNYFNNVRKLPKLPYLQTLSLSNCSIDNIKENAFENIPNVKIIFLRGNKLSAVPSAISSVNNLEELYIESQNIRTQEVFFISDYIFQNLTNLTKLSLSRMRLEYLLRYSLNGAMNLKVLFLSQTYLYEIEDYAFETLTSLETLDLRGNGLKFISNFTFYGLVKLKHLYLVGNFINFCESVFPFQFSPLLSFIFLQLNKIELLPEGMFSKNEHLEILILGRNKISPWDKRILHPKTRLKVFGLSENNIDHISEVMLEEFNQVCEFLDIAKNPFNCSKCGMKEFQEFCLATNLSLGLPAFEANENDYKCMNPQIFFNKNFFEVDLPENICAIEAHLLNMMTILLACIFLILVIILAFISYTFRWYIRYWIFHIKTDFKRKISSYPKNNFTYDAFIIYSSCDTSWVVNYLVPELENQQPFYKLCIHQRDFQVGRQITENILEAIENSRKVILILSDGFIKSEWCMYELHLALHKLFKDTRDTLILVKLKVIDKKLYSKNLSYIEKTRRCFMWTDSHIGQKLFWNKIRKQLGQPNSQGNFQITTSKC